MAEGRQHWGLNHESLIACSNSLSKPKQWYCKLVIFSVFYFSFSFISALSDATWAWTCRLRFMILGIDHWPTFLKLRLIKWLSSILDFRLFIYLNRLILFPMIKKRKELKLVFFTACHIWTTPLRLISPVSGSLYTSLKLCGRDSNNPLVLPLRCGLCATADQEQSRQAYRKDSVYSFTRGAHVSLSVYGCIVVLSFFFFFHFPRVPQTERFLLEVHSWQHPEYCFRGARIFF